MTKPSAFERAAAEIRELDLVDVDKVEEQLGASASRAVGERLATLEDMTAALIPTTTEGALLQAALFLHELEEGCTAAGRGDDEYRAACMIRARSRGWSLVHALEELSGKTRKEVSADRYIYDGADPFAAAHKGMSQSRLVAEAPK